MDVSTFSITEWITSQFEKWKNRKWKEKKRNRSSYVVFIMCDEYKIACIGMNYVWWWWYDRAINQPNEGVEEKKKWLNYKFNCMSLKRLFIVDIKCNLSYEHEHLVGSVQVWGRLAKFLVKLQSQVCKWTRILIDIWCFDSMFRSNYNFVLLFCSFCLVNEQVR